MRHRSFVGLGVGHVGPDSLLQQAGRQRQLIEWVVGACCMPSDVMQHACRDVMQHACRNRSDVMQHARRMSCSPKHHYLPSTPSSYQPVMYAIRMHVPQNNANMENMLYVEASHIRTLRFLSFDHRVLAILTSDRAWQKGLHRNSLMDCAGAIPGLGPKSPKHEQSQSLRFGKQPEATLLWRVRHKP